MTSKSSIVFGAESGSHFKIASVERFADNSGWRGILNLRSGSFALIDHIFYFDELIPFQKHIKSIYTTLTGTASLRLRYETDVIELRASSRGHIKVKGHVEMIGEETNKLDFEFDLDQTFLSELISSVDHVVEETR